jgi:uridine kinase
MDNCFKTQMLEFNLERDALLKIQQATKEMEKSKEKRAANAKLLSDELDKIPTKQPIQKAVFKHQQKSQAVINEKRIKTTSNHAV